MLGGHRDHAPEIPWDDLAGMRHRLVHAYFDMNLGMLWQTAQEDVPALIPLLEPHVPDDSPQPGSPRAPALPLAPLRFRSPSLAHPP